MFAEKCKITSNYGLDVVGFLLKDKITTGKRKHEDDEPVFEQIENTSDPARCPVKMFECYLSKRYVCYGVMQKWCRVDQVQKGTALMQRERDSNKGNGLRSSEK